MSVEGTYECTLKTPLGKKKGTLVVVPSADGQRFTGNLSNSLLGSVDITDGTLDGDVLIFQVAVTKPKRMNVECEIVVDGDDLVGIVTAGMFGELKLSGQRIG
ncbi:MAG: hypothetical protein ABIT04_05480 [Novosphingobium sp.]